VFCEIERVVTRNDGNVSLQRVDNILRFLSEILCQKSVQISVNQSLFLAISSITFLACIKKAVTFLLLKRVIQWQGKEISTEPP